MASPRRAWVYLLLKLACFDAEVSVSGETDGYGNSCSAREAGVDDLAGDTGVTGVYLCTYAV